MDEHAVWLLRDRADGKAEPARRVLPHRVVPGDRVERAIVVTDALDEPAHVRLHGGEKSRGCAGFTWRGAAPAG
jgi:hypothetical protein